MFSASKVEAKIVADVDRYYTPENVAHRALECAQLTEKPQVCADTACGNGRLLLASEHVLGSAFSLGIDTDAQTIRQLRRERPNWRLYVGDLLKRRRAPPTHFSSCSNGVDLLVLNPPFSLGHKKSVLAGYCGQQVRCSIAMAHILRSIDLFRPKLGIIAVVPESLLHSDTDHRARELLSLNFSTSELIELSIYTFKGARVNSAFVQLRPISERPALTLSRTRPLDPIYVSVVRGGMPFHTLTLDPSGARFVHSTSLESITTKGIESVTTRTSVRLKGRVSGWLLLLPRVGVPRREAFGVTFAPNELQLSDCVVGLSFSTEKDANCAKKRIIDEWESLLSIYRGTGARYVTISRLVDWLLEIGIFDKDASKGVAAASSPSS